MEGERPRAQGTGQGEAVQGQREMKGYGADSCPRQKARLDGPQGESNLEVFYILVHTPASMHR